MFIRRLDQRVSKWVHACMNEWMNASNCAGTHGGSQELVPECRDNPVHYCHHPHRHGCCRERSVGWCSAQGRGACPAHGHQPGMSNLLFLCMICSWQEIMTLACLLCSHTILMTIVILIIIITITSKMKTLCSSWWMSLWCAHMLLI